MADSVPNILLVLNEPTPYRMHLINRFANEISGISIKIIFTQSMEQLSVPWKIEIDKGLDVARMPMQHSIPHAKSHPEFWKLGGEIIEYIKSMNIRFVMLHGYNDLSRYRVLRYCKKHMIPTFIRGDSNIFDERSKSAIKRLVKKIFLGDVFSRASGSLAMGTAGKAYFLNYMPEDKPIFQVPYEPDYDSIRGVCEDERTQFLDSFQLVPDRRRLLYCGRMIRIKRVDMLIRSFCNIAEQREGWDLVLAGTGPDQEALRSLVPAEFMNRIKWLGFLQFDQIRCCYAACDVLVHPSIYEPWGLVVQEAVAAGLSVITTDVVGSAIDLVKHNTNGMLIPPNNQDELEKAILESTKPQTLALHKQNASFVLDQWQRAADPVHGMKSALRYSKIL